MREQFGDRLVQFEKPSIGMGVEGDIPGPAHSEQRQIRRFKLRFKSLQLVSERAGVRAKGHNLLRLKMLRSNK